MFVGIFASTGYVWGIVLARLTHQPRGGVVSMTYLCGMRNISAGAVIVTAYFPGEAMKELAEVLKDWEAVIGLEVHTELTTLDTKMFCNCRLSHGGFRWFGR